MEGPKVSTSHMAQLAEDMSTFFEEEKLRAQSRIRKCEMFMNDVRLESKSVHEGLIDLLRNAEEDYSTLLHLERVLNMRNCGDFAPGLSNANIPQSSEAAGIRGAAAIASGDSKRAEEDAFHDGDGFMMSSSGSPNVKEVDEDFDPLFQSMQDIKRSPKCSSGKTSKRPQNDQHFAEESDVIDDEDGAHPSQGGRQIRGSSANDQLSVAQSLPVNIPMPEFKGKLLDLTSDVDEDATDIPKKMAEIARSLYDHHGPLASSPGFTQNI